MHNYEENGKTAIQGRLINGRFTGSLQQRYGCSFETGQIYLTRPFNPRWQYSTQVGFKVLLNFNF